jgi:hypothetical protein
MGLGIIIMEDCFINNIIDDIKKSKKINLNDNNDYYLSNDYFYLISTNNEYILNIIKNYNYKNYNYKNYYLELNNYFIISPYKLYDNKNYLYILQYKLPISNINYNFLSDNFLSDNFNIIKYILNNKLNINKLNIISCKKNNDYIIIDNIILKNNDIYNYYIFNVEKTTLETNVEKIEGDMTENDDYNIDNPTNKLREYISIDIF